MTAARMASGAAPEADGGSRASVRQRLGKRYENRKHLEWVASLPCLVTGGQAQVHHLLRPWSGIRGTGRKSGDENTVPLSPEYHTALHMRGDEEAWSFEQLGHVAALRGAAERIWLASPYWEALVQQENEKEPK